MVIAMLSSRCTHVFVIACDLLIVNTNLSEIARAAGDAIAVPLMKAKLTAQSQLVVKDNWLFHLTYFTLESFLRYVMSGFNGEGS